MSVVSLLGVNILNNPAKFTDNYQFEITFECLEQLEKGKQTAIWQCARLCASISIASDFALTIHRLMEQTSSGS